MVHSFYAIPCSDKSLQPCKLGLIYDPKEGGLSICIPGLSCVPSALEAELRASELIGCPPPQPTNSAAEAEGRPLELDGGQGRDSGPAGKMSQGVARSASTTTGVWPGLKEDPEFTSPRPHMRSPATRQIQDHPGEVWTDLCFQGSPVPAWLFMLVKAPPLTHTWGGRWRWKLPEG